METNKLTFLAFWAINDELLVDKACSQLKEMKRLGLDGVVFHPRNYPGLPEYLGEEYMAVLSDIITYAKGIGMEFWLYDENGFPSGTASGKVLLENPGVKCMWVEYSEGKVVLREKSAVSTLDAKACRDFVRITFEGYKQGLSKEAFAYVSGVFSDEVAFLDGVSVSLKYGGIPWCEVLEDCYRKSYGEELKDKLQLLFEEGEGYELVRERYWELLSKMLRENFYAPIHQWCEENGKRYTAHLKGEENIFFNISYNGSPYEILQEVSVPAVDALERYPGNHYYPHIASSIAKQFFDGSCLCEAMGGSGWGVSPEDFVTYMKWLVDCGINMMTFHLAQYTLKAQAIRDWPPSLPFHVSWKEAFPEALRRIREYKVQLEEEERGKERVLIVTPTRGCMRQFVPKDAMCINEHNGAGVPDRKAGKISNAYGKLIERCYKEGILFDVTEESILEKYGRISKDGIQIGKMHYNHVLLGEGCCFHEQEIIKQLRAYGLEIKLPHEEKHVAQKIISRRIVLGEDREEWQILHDRENQLLLEPIVDGNDNIRRCCIGMESIDGTEGIRLMTSDPVSGVRVNGRDVHGQAMRFDIPQKLLKGDCLSIEVKPLERGEQKPFLFLQGDFLVKNKKGYEHKDCKHLYTEGEFILSAGWQGVCVQELVQSGFPFRIQPVTLRKKISIPDGAVCLKLSDFEAAAARIWIDGEDPIWFFSEAEPVWLPKKSKNRECLIWVELYPSTYNVYGPHHHRDGDRYLISPAQYSGRKNFADFQDSPEQTLVKGYHFVKFGLGNKLIFQGEEK